jgi:hypothetical protein
MDQQRFEGLGNDPERLAEWDLLVADAIQEAERRLADEKAQERTRAIQLAREQGYHRLALEIDRPRRGKRVSPSQLSFFPERNPTLFESNGSDS